MADRIAGKVAIVSGGAQGIGEAIVRLFAAEGAAVVIADIQDAKGEALAAAIGDRAAFVHVDVTRTADWSQAISDATARFGGVDILVNNAGGAVAIMPLVDEDEASHRKVLDINVTGCWAGLRAAVPAMAARGGGSIVNISSMDGLVGVAEMATYAAAKFAVTGLTRSLALEVGKDNIRVNAVHPGFIATPLTEGASPASRARLDRALARQPIARMGRATEVAQAVLFLASDESSYCTGSSLVVDGGHIAGPHRDPIERLD